MITNTLTAGRIRIAHGEVAAFLGTTAEIGSVLMVGFEPETRWTPEEALGSSKASANDMDQEF